MSKKEWDLIRITKELHSDLTSLGEYGDSMNSIIKKLYDSYINNSKQIDAITREVTKGAMRGMGPKRKR